MGISGIGPGSLLLILLIILLLFGTKKIKSLGSDLGTALKGFRNAVSDDKDNTAGTGDAEKKPANEAARVIDAESVDAGPVDTESGSKTGDRG